MLDKYILNNYSTTSIIRVIFIHKADLIILIFFRRRKKGEDIIRIQKHSDSIEQDIRKTGRMGGESKYYGEKW